MSQQAEPRPVKREDPKEPYNAGDAEHVREREKASKRRADRVREGLRFVMSDPRGRLWMHHMLTEKLFIGVGKFVPPDSFTGNSTTFYNTGAKRVGEVLRAELLNICRGEFRTMEDEGDA